MLNIVYDVVDKVELSFAVDIEYHYEELVNHNEFCEGDVRNF